MMYELDMYFRYTLRTYVVMMYVGSDFKMWSQTLPPEPRILKIHTVQLIAEESAIPGTMLQAWIHQTCLRLCWSTEPRNYSYTTSNSAKKVVTASKLRTLTYQRTKVRRLHSYVRKHTVRPCVFTFLFKSFDSQLELVTHAYQTMKWKGVSMLMEF